MPCRRPRPHGESRENDTKVAIWLLKYPKEKTGATPRVLQNWAACGWPVYFTGGREGIRTPGAINPLAFKASAFVRSATLPPDNLSGAHSPANGELRELGAYL